MATLAAAMERVEREARLLRPARVVLTVIAVPLFVLGWVASKVLLGLWLVLAWAWTATLVGWRTARTPRPVR